MGQRPNLEINVGLYNGETKLKNKNKKCNIFWAVEGGRLEAFISRGYNV